MANIDINSDSKIVSGYQKAFIHSDFQSDPEYSPQLVSNSGGKKVLTVIEKELKNCDEVFISVAFITRGGVAPLLGTLKELEAKNHVNPDNGLSDVQRSQSAGYTCIFEEYRVENVQNSRSRCRISH